MTGSPDKDNRFGTIAVEMNIIAQEEINRAVVVQTRIFEKSRVKMPIGQILLEMGAITADQRDEILRVQVDVDGSTETGKEDRSSARPAAKDGLPVDISVSKDKLSALAAIVGKSAITELEVEDVKKILQTQGIVHGIADDVRIGAFLNGEFKDETHWPIATGTAPIPDSPSEVIYHFNTDPLKIGTLTEAGLMDWKDRGQLPQVKEGDLLAEKIPGPKGRQGTDVYGKTLPIPKLREPRFKCGKGVRRSADGTQVQAALSGMPRLSITGEISVMPTLHIPGDISLETGHVEFDGHIDVAGAVEKGYRVKGGSLRAGEIHDARVDVDGDITATHGIFGATIRSGGNLKAGHIHHADILLSGDMAVEREIVESRIEVNGRCLINDGIILSSTVSAKMGVIAMDIGTRASKPSELIVGVDRRMEREVRSIKNEIRAVSAKRDDLPKLIDDLKRQSEDVNTRLGKVAQLQDTCMVQHRRLQDRIGAGLLEQRGDAADQLDRTVKELEARQDRFDREVARLMEADDSIGQQIAAAESEIAQHTETLRDLNDRLEEMTEAVKAVPGAAVAKIGGNVFSGTKITGPHSVLILQDDLKRLSIVETDRPDHEGVKRWRFELDPFR